MNRAMMALYKEEKLNPRAGYLPIVVQIPVYIVPYWLVNNIYSIAQQWPITRTIEKAAAPAKSCARPRASCCSICRCSSCPPAPAL